MKNERLIKVRGNRSRPEFAAEVGVHKNTLARYESGERDPDGTFLVRLAERGWNPMWVLTGVGEEKLPPEALPTAAADTALIVVRGDREAEVRRNDTIRALGSQTGRLDPETITSALKLLTWAFDLQGAVYDPGRDPDLLAETYAFLVEHDGALTPDNLIDFSKRLAEKRAKEATGAIKQGMGGHVPGKGNS